MALTKWGQREAGEGRPGPEEAVACTRRGGTRCTIDGGAGSFSRGLRRVGAVSGGNGAKWVGSRVNTEGAPRYLARAAECGRENGTD